MYYFITLPHKQDHNITQVPGMTDQTNADSSISGLSAREFQRILSSRIMDIKKETDFGAFDEGLEIPGVLAFTIVHWALLETLSICLLLGVIKVTLQKVMPAFFITDNSFFATSS